MDLLSTLMRSVKFFMAMLVFGVSPLCHAGLGDALFNSGRNHWPPKTSATGTLENKLDPIFAQFSADCGIIPYDDDTSTSSFIPNDLRQESSTLGLGKHVIVVPEDSAKRLMAFIYNKSDITQIRTSSRIDSSKFVIIDADDLTSAPVPREGSDTVGYKHTCSSYLNAALEANLRLPIASMSSAVKAETTETANLILVRGTFENPIYTRYKALDAETLLAFWVAYIDGGGYSSNLKIVKGFDGVVLIRAKTSDRKVDFKLGAQVGATSPIYSGTLSAAAGLNNETALKSAQYMTYIFEPTATDSLFGPAPTPTEIQDAFSRVGRSISFAGKARPLMFIDVPFQATTELKSIPFSLCNGTNLKVSAQPEKLQLKAPTTYEVKYETNTAGEKVCKVTLTGYQPDSVTPPQNLRLEYTISSREVHNIDTGTDATLSIPVAIDVRASNQPAYRQPPAPIDGRKVGGNVEWAYFVDFLEADRTLDRLRLGEIASEGTPHLVCQGNKSDLQVTVAIISSKVHLSFQGSQLGATGDICTVSDLSLDLPAQGASNLVISPVSVQLRMP